MMECKVMGITMYYEEYGSGRPFLGLHGLPLDHCHMVHEYEPLFDNRTGWRRIYPDMPGMGQTPAPDWITNIGQMLDVLVAFVDAVAPGERFIAAGTSFGGGMARGLVQRRGSQMDGVMLNVSKIDDRAKYQPPAHRVIHEDPAFLSALQPGEDIVNMLVVQSLETLQSIRTYYETAGAIADQAFINRLMQDLFTFDREWKQPFDAPALILAGRFDTRCGYKSAFDLLDQYTRATYAALDRTSHALVMEENGLFLELGRNWLDRVEEYIQYRSTIKISPAVNEN